MSPIIHVNANFPCAPTFEYTSGPKDLVNRLHYTLDQMDVAQRAVTRKIIDDNMLNSI